METETQDEGIRIQQRTTQRFIELPKSRFDLLQGPLLEGIVEVGLDAFGEGMTREEILEHLFPTDRIYVAYTGGRVLGFATAKLKEDSVDLVGVAVQEEQQGNGLYSELCLRRVNLGLDRGRKAVELRTQNPKIELGVCRCLDGLTRIGIIPGYDVEREVIEGMYGRMLTSRRPFSGVDQIDRLYDVLDYARGDTFSFRFNLRSG